MALVLQPENIFVVISADGEHIIKIADFDTSCALERDATTRSRTNTGDLINNFYVSDRTVDAITILRTILVNVFSVLEQESLEQMTYF